MTATHYRGSDGEIQIEGNPVTMVNYEITVETNVIASPRIGKVADMNYAGKQSITGTVEQVLITGDLLSMVIGDSNTLTTSSAENLLVTYDLDAIAREEIPFDVTTPTDPTSVKVTMTAGSVSTAAGSIVIHGTNISDGYVTEVINLAAMVSGDPAQVVYGSQIFKTTTYVDIEAALSEAGTPDPTLTIDGITGTKTMTPGNATIFDIIGKVEDDNGNYFQMTCNNCFFTAGNFPIGDSDTLVACVLPFVVHDADSDVSLVWTST